MIVEAFDPVHEVGLVDAVAQLGLSQLQVVPQLELLLSPVPVRLVVVLQLAQVQPITSP